MSGILDGYLNMVPSANRAKPKFIADLSIDLKIFDTLFTLCGQIDSIYKIDNAFGSWLDVIGEVVGASRRISISETEAYYLNDEDYKIYIKATIAKNAWNGQIDSLQDLWFELFGTHIGILDNQNMSINVYIIGNFSNNILRLIKANKIIPKPVGVKINYYILKNRIFSYDYDNMIYTGYEGDWSNGDIESDDELLSKSSFGLVNANDEYEESNLDGFGEGVWRQ
jgi:hypothetical protein